MRMECEKNVKREKPIIDEAIGANACTKAEIFNAFLTADFHNEGTVQSYAAEHCY